MSNVVVTKYGNLCILFEGIYLVTGVVSKVDELLFTLKKVKFA